MKSVKNLLVPFIILIALIIGVIVYYVVSSNGHTVQTETQNGLTDVVFYNSSDIASLTVYNRDTGLTSKVNCSTDANGTVNYEYLGDDIEAGAKYSQSRLSNYVGLLTYFACNAKVSTTGNYSEFGLDDPSYVITINAVNGVVTTVNLGDRTPDGKACYLYVSGSQDIYTVTAVKLAEAEKSGINFLESTMFRVKYSDLKSVHFDRRTDGLSLDANVVMTASGIANFEIYKPYSHAASPYFGTLIDQITNLEISEFVNIDSDELAKYGLKDPDYHFVLTLNNGEKKELYVSRQIDGYYYASITGMDKYFMLSIYQLDGLDLQELVLVDPYICYCFAKDISSITGTYGDNSFKFELYVPEGEAISSDRAQVTLDGRNGKIVDSEGRSYCSILFESIACIKIGGVDVDAKVNTASGPALSLSFIDNKFETTVYDFYLRDPDSYYVLKNGVYMGFYVYSREIFNNGGRDTYNYGYWSAYELLSKAISNNTNGIYDITEE